MSSKTLVNLISLLILNCVGSGLIMLPPRLVKLGTSSFIAWTLTGVGALAIGMIFVRLGEMRDGKDYYLHNLVASQAKGKFAQLIRYVFFWQYLLFGILGNAVLSCTIVSALIQIFPILNHYSSIIHLSIFFIFYFLNRFGLELSENAARLFTVLKIIILVVFPFLVLLFVKPTIPLLVSNDPFKDTIKGMFITLWPFVGIESISMESGYGKRTMRRAMILGVLFCLGVFLLNTYVLMINVPGLDKSSSAYSDLFGILFGGGSKWIMNVLIIAIVLGSLHGWTHTSLSTANSAPEMLPSYLKRWNEHNVNESALSFISLLPPSFIFFTQFVLRSEQVFYVIIDTTSSLCLLIYLSGIIAFIVAILKKQKKNLLDCLIAVLGLIYTIVAIQGSGGVPMSLAALSFSVFAVIFWVNEKA